MQRLTVSSNMVNAVSIQQPFIKFLASVAVLVASADAVLAQDNNDLTAGISATLANIFADADAVHLNVIDVYDLGDTCKLDVTLENRTEVDFENYAVKVFFYDSDGWRLADTSLTSSGRFLSNERLRDTMQSYQVSCDKIQSIIFELIHVRPNTDLPLQVFSEVPDILVEWRQD